MDLRELGYFVAVFEERSVSAAARRCYISQPSVSAAVAALETELGTRLFFRHRRGAAPTAAAEQLYPTAVRLLGEAQALRAAFRKPAAVRQITVGLMRSLDAHRVRELLAAIAGAPELRVRLVAADARCDLRVVSRALVRSAESFAPLWSERYVVALPASHPLALRETLRVADLSGQPMIERCHCELGRKLARRRPRLDPVATAESEEWALALVGAGVGLAIVPEGSVRDDRHVVLRALADVSAARQVGVAWRAGSALASEVHRLCESLRGRFGAVGGRRSPTRAARAPHARS